MVAGKEFLFYSRSPLPFCQHLSAKRTALPFGTVFVSSLSLV